MSDKKEKVQHPHHTIRYRKITKTGLNDFSDFVKSDMTKRNHYDFKDINKNTNNFSNIMIENINRIYAPVIEKRVRSLVRAPWINTKILHAQRTRDTLKQQKFFQEYKIWQNKCVNMVRRAKQKHYETAIKGAKGNTVKLCKHINSFKQSKPVTLPKILSINNEIITEQDRILEELKKFL